MKPENNKCLTKKEDSLNKPKETEMSSKEFFKSKRSKEKSSSKLREKDKLCSNNMLRKSENRSCKMMNWRNNTRLNTQKKEENSNKNSKTKNHFLNISKT